MINKIKEYVMFPRQFMVFCLKSLLVIVLVLGIFLFFSQDKFKDNLYGNYVTKLVSNFFDSVTTGGPVAVVKKWMDVNPGNIKINKEEKLVQYKLNILSKSLDNYFQDLLRQTDAAVSSPLVSSLMNNTSYRTDNRRLKAYLRSYLINNPDIMEISIYNRKGVKMSTVKYKSVSEYAFNKKLLDALKKSDNILLKHSHSKNLILLSSIKNGDKFDGVVSQTLNPVFFTKILDFLNINENLFYLKNMQDELVLDNYSAYQFINNKKHSFPYLFYRKLTRSSETQLTLNVDNVDYALGVIIDENNMLGDILAIILMFLIVYAASLLINIIWKNISKIGFLVQNRKAVSNEAFINEEEKIGNIPETTFDEIDKAIHDLQKTRPEKPNNELFADSFIKK